jgi:Flp pilus assembly protein TadD
MDRGSDNIFRGICRTTQFSSAALQRQSTEAQVVTTQGQGGAGWQPATRSAATFLEEALAHLQGGNAVASEALLRRLLEREPYSIGGLHLLGLIAYQARRLEEAGSLFARAIAAGRDNPDIYSNYGAVLNWLCRHSEAETACRRAIALAPDYAEALYNLAAARPIEIDDAAALESMVADGGLPVNERTAQYFALAEIRDGRHGRACFPSRGGG